MLNLFFCVFVVQLSMVIAIQTPFSKEPILTIEDGTIRGRESATIEQRKTYYAFQGIPYAHPPLDSLRFMPPVRNEKWSGILDATRDKSPCVQGFNPVVGKEDCLYINVYTPTLEKRNLAVIVWIYGGGFILGDSLYDSYGPDHLLDEDVIFVQFNYRTGSFGFLSTHDLVCPGNNGLRDQLFALKWVQRNIEYFGGDPRNVTVYGQSAGAASVAYLVQTELSEGLFKAAIMSSGTSLCRWSWNRKALDTAFALGKALQVNTTNSESLVDGLRKINYIKLQQINREVLMHNPMRAVQFSPVIEPHHKDAVVLEPSRDVLANGKFHHVPILMGINSNEAAAPWRIPPFVDFLLDNELTNSDFAPADLTEDEKLQSEAGEKIRLHYFGDQPPRADPAKVVQFISDIQWNYPIATAVSRMSKFVPVYFYGFWYEGDLGGTGNRIHKGVAHSEDLGYIFRSNITPTSSHDYVVGRRMVKIITNFAKFSDPTPKTDDLLQGMIWPVTSALPKNSIMMKIDYDLELTLNPWAETVEFFDTIYGTYGTSPEEY